ncbi:hypothetical protein BKA62DRAFT_741755 [Auriculariales sp. MPI-PUGE-AT-0066]|nr:hypothetical protein BKA62DRAFT_741755 [Auriculariales sp. MPI-PUGE-AT-0066]
MDPPYLYPGKVIPRKFSGRKQYLYNRYRNIIDASATGTPFLVLSHADFTANQLIKFRQDVAQAKPRGVKEPWDENGRTPTLEVITSAIFGVALREHPVARNNVGRVLANSTQVTGGSFAVLRLPSLDPPRLAAVLKAVEKFIAVHGPKPEDAAAEAAKRKGAEDLATPGRRAKRIGGDLGPRCRVFEGEGVKTVSSLPDIGTLRAQVVGLLTAPAGQIAALLGEASGAKLARTLEGLKKSLEEDGAPPSA